MIVMEITEKLTVKISGSERHLILNFNGQAISMSSTLRASFVLSFCR